MERMLLTPDEVANLLGLGRTKVYALLGSGSLPCVRIGNRLRIPVEGLRDWVARQHAAGEVAT
jgi:excisionase family DNA binding protein